MKIAFSVTANNGLDSLIDARFGRASGFLVIGEANETQYISNEQNLNAPQGAGIQAAQYILDSGAEAVVTAHCGPKAFRVLSGSGIKVYIGVEKTVKDALAAIASGTMKATDNANVEGHW
jgi:predicted Fe-Mo cluster-binding NifX family protein